MFGPFFLALAPLVQVAGPPAGPGPWLTARQGLGRSRRVFEVEGRGRVAFLGGSITFNPGWRDQVCAELKRRFPDTEFDFVAAGIPSTGSTPGAFRLKRDVFARGRVDLLFEEAAVNDSTNGRGALEQLRGMEGIVRHARRRNPEIDIVLLHFADPSKLADYRAGRVPEVIETHERVAEHYGLPSLDLAREVTERIDRGEFTWEGDFRDLHPSPFGQDLYAESVRRLFELEYAGDRPLRELSPRGLPSALDPFSYERGRLAPPNEASPGPGFAVVERWANTAGGGTRPGFVGVPMLVSERPGARFALDFTGTAVGLFVAAGPDAGVIEYRVDAGTWIELDLFTPWSAGLHLPFLYVLDAEATAGVAHRLEVRIAERRNPKSRGHACRVVHFALNDG